MREGNKKIVYKPRPFHKIRPDYQESCIRKYLDQGLLTEDDAQLIRDFLRDLAANNQISLLRLNKFAFILVGWRRYLKPFREVTKDDLDDALIKFKNSPIRVPTLPNRKVTECRVRKFKQNTQRDYIALLKRFYYWCIKNDKGVKIKKKHIRDIHAPKKDTKTVSQGDLFSEEEIHAMMKACLTTRDRALLMTMWEGALRACEIGALTWRDLNFMQNYVTLTTNGKTGFVRHVTLVQAHEYLMKWKNEYTLDPRGSNPVFITQKNYPLNYDAIRIQLKKIAYRAGIDKDMKPRFLRHSRITESRQKGDEYHSTDEDGMGKHKNEHDGNI